MSPRENTMTTLTERDTKQASHVGAPAAAQPLGAALQAFTRWLAAFGETSYDHQSYFAGPLGGRAKALYYRRGGVGILAVAPMIASEALFPVARQLFWKKQRFPIADAHYAMGFAYLARTTGERAHLDRAAHFLQVLEQTRCPGYRHAGWGYPFDWVTRNGVMKAQTPLITSTPYVYEAFAAVHAIDGHRRWLDTMASAAEHAYTDIPEQDVGDDEATCAYNPLGDQFRVVNANAYRSFLLFAAARQFDRDDYAQTARRNLNFVLHAQREDGSWPYATDGVRDFVDHFHTCFVLKALAKIEGLTGDANVRRAIDAGVWYYVQNLFDEYGLPRPFAVAPRLTVYKHELYDYAECINLATLLAGRYPVLDQRLESTLADLFARWRKPDGSFRSRKLMLGWDNVPMHRWAQAQLFRSLAFLHASRQDRLAETPARSHAVAPAAPSGLSIATQVH